MFCVSNLFLLYLLLLCTVIQSIPTTNLQHRYQRNALTKFPQHGDFNLVLQNGDDFLEFEICCKNSNGCLGNFTVCFATSDQKQTADTFGCYSSKTCAYQIKFKDKPNFVLNTQKFTTEEQCFTD
uniref:Uncharacterized protein n=1 Tax=Panagrolaimus superbus TaxID=310955 RepID=A0A914YME3_9BILA